MTDLHIQPEETAQSDQVDALDDLIGELTNAHQRAFNEVNPHGNGMSPYDGSLAVSKRTGELVAEAMSKLSAREVEAKKQGALNALTQLKFDRMNHMLSAPEDELIKIIDFIDIRIKQLQQDASASTESLTASGKQADNPSESA